ncbi:hypothetical protein Ccr5_gp326 [Caulobacter phage Ccr5]|nr:hypothetical protein Ccr5_gp008 [Caulobacter phage Ccr5]ARB14546.1 hypothetical protein Ccr5_gp326 [Caulobacter phage Ccr5]
MKPVIVLELDQASADAVSEALAHVWREVFDKSRTGAAGKLRAVLDRLNTVTPAKR